LSAKGGLMMGTKKVGAPSSPQKRADSIIAKKKDFVNEILNFFICKFILTLPLVFYKKMAGKLNLNLGNHSELDMFLKTKI
jgi:hypothetical protein